MRNQAFVLAACAAVVIGCGGGGGGSNRGSTGSTPTPGSGMAVNLSASSGLVEVSYLTGQGRATGDLYLQITRQTIANGDGVDVMNRDSPTPLTLRLDGFQTLNARINVPFGVTTTGRANSQNFSQLLFDPNKVQQESSTGSLTDAGTLPDNLPVTLDARIRAFPGRSTVVQLRVSSATFLVDSSTGGYSFDEELFKELNYSNTGTDPDAQNRVASRFSDFVRFPLANVPIADRPNLRSGFEDGDEIVNGAQYVYFSGDNVALSSGGGGTGSIFQEVGDVFTDVLLGKWADAAAGGFLGTYDLRDALPSDETGVSRIVSIYGQFRDYNTVLSGGTTFEIVMFPNSGETYTFEGNDNSGIRGRAADIVAFVRNSNNQIVNMYFGAADFGAQTTSGTFELFPIRGLGADPADPDIVAARLVGTISSFRDANGTTTNNPAAVRSFNYSFTSPGLPTGFTSSGNVTVFRK